jgi:hypothetical protein
MSDEQAKIVIELLKKCIFLLEKQVALFEKYDAESFFDEEEIRKQIFNSPSSRRP